MSKKRLAVVLFGQVKNYNEVQHKQFVDLILPSLTRYDIDYYLVTTKNKTYTTDRYADIEPNNSKIDYLSINKFFNFKKLIYDDLDQHVKIMEIHKLTNKLVNDFDFQAWERNNRECTFRSLKQLYSLNYFLNDFLSKIDDYDHFIVMRSDLFFTKKLKLPLDIANNSIYVPSFGHYGPGIQEKDKPWYKRKDRILKTIKKHPEKMLSSFTSSHKSWTNMTLEKKKSYIIKNITQILHISGMHKPKFTPWTGGCNDRFCFITSRDILKLYCGRYNKLKFNPEAYHSEHYLNTILKRAGIKYSEIADFKFRLLRSNNKITDLIGTSEDETLTSEFYND